MPRHPVLGALWPQGLDFPPELLPPVLASPALMVVRGDSLMSIGELGAMEEMLLGGKLDYSRICLSSFSSNPLSRSL